MISGAFVLIRAIHFASCLLMVGVLGFDRLMLAPVANAGNGVLDRRWDRLVQGMMWFLLPAIVLSGAGWLGCVAVNMSGLPWNQAIGPSVLEAVWNRTTFGTVWQWRLVCWAGACIMFLMLRFGRWPAWMNAGLKWGRLAAGAAVAGGLVGAGHGMEGPGWRRAADVAHLVAAGIWPMGIVPLLWTMWILRGVGGEGQRLRGMLVRRFSIVSLLVVGLLGASGVVNGCFLVGSVRGLVSSAYGRWLMAKVLLYLVMAGLGAVNLVRWRPRLPVSEGGDEQASASAARWICVDAGVELALGGVVIVIVAVLGLLPPPAR